MTTLRLGLALAGLAVLAACGPLARSNPTAAGEAYPLATAGPTASPLPYPGPSLDPTQAAIVARKATAAAAVRLTQTAAPTATTTPTYPVGATLCRAQDLALSASAQGATGAIVFGVAITNTSQAVCALPGPPDIKLVDQAGNPVDVDYSLRCFTCGQAELGQTSVPAPTQTAAAQTALSGRLGLGPNERAGVDLIWRNWCQPFPPGGIKVRLTLPDELGSVVGPTDAYVGGRCDVPGVRSTVTVSEYYRIP